MGISEDQFFQDAQQYIRTIWTCMTDGYAHYRSAYPDLDIHRKATRANIVSDLIFARVVSAFDEVPGTRIIFQESTQVRFLSISDSVTLWFKKLDENRQTHNYPTDEAIKRDGGQGNLFQEASIIIAGYMLNEDETEVKSVCFAPPNKVSPRWYVDVEAIAQPIQMKGFQRTSPRVRLKITRGPEQTMIN